MSRLLELRSVFWTQELFDNLLTFRVHVSRPGGNPVWRFGDGAEGSAPREVWGAFVLKPCELGADTIEDGLDAERDYMDGTTETVTFELHDGTKLGFRVEPAARPDERRDAVLAEIRALAQRFREQR